MRLISQDGMLDIPYEMAAVYVEDIHILADIGDNHWRMATYFEEKGAVYAMKEMRCAYALHKQYQNGSIPDIDIPERLIDGLHGVFRFPEDDEVSSR